jgi:citrate synthase
VTTETTSSPAKTAGLQGVTAGDTSLSRVDGEKGRLYYCGIPIEPLSEQSTFEECVYLLWNDRLPTAAELEAFVASLRAEQEIPAEVFEILRPLAAKGMSQMDLLRTGMSALAAFDPDVKDVRDGLTGKGELERKIAARIMARVGSLVTGAYRLSHGDEPLAPRDDLSIAGNFLYQLTGEVPHEAEERIFDASLTLHADHGFNASTFCARVTAGTEADLYAACTSAIGTLAGRLHGGANERVMRLLEEIGEVDAVESHIQSILAQPKGRVMGFGHRVYKVEDPRATVLRRMADDLTTKTGHRKWFEMSRAIEDIMMAKGIAPNVDFYSASVYGSLALDPGIFTPIFAVSRTSGWLAHVLEQHADNRLIRPRANYIGQPDGRAFVALADR